MNDYLQQLERLGGLHASGVLTKEEFEAEKTRILGQHSSTTHDYSDAAGTPWYGDKRVLGGGLLAIVLAGAALGLSTRFDSTPDEDQKSGRIADRSLAAERDQQGSENGSFGFANASKCQPNAALAGLLSRIEEAGQATDREGRLVFVSGTDAAATVRSATVKAAGQEIKLAAAPINAEVIGLPAVEVRSMSWPSATGIRITFDEGASELRRRAEAAGFALSAQGGAIVSEAPAGSSITCFSEAKVDRDSEETSSAS